MKKHMIHEEEGYTMDVILHTKEAYHKLFGAVDDYRTRMRRLTMNFDGDEMAARSYKHATNSSKVSAFPAVYHVIKGAKIQIDRLVGQNQGVLDNEAFLKRMISQAAREEMKKTKLNSSLTRENFEKLVESLFEQYEEEYQH